MQKSVQLLVLMLVTLQLNSSNCESAERVFHLKDLVADCKNKIEIFVKLSDEANGEVHKLIFILSTGEIVNDKLSIKIEGNYNKSDTDLMPCVYQGINKNNHSSVFGVLSKHVFRSEFEINNKWYEIEPFNLSETATAIANPIVINATELNGNNYESIVNILQPTDIGDSINYTFSSGAAIDDDVGDAPIRKKRSVQVGAIYGRPAKILRLAVVADESFVTQAGGQQAAVSRVVEIINFASGVYRSLNLRLVLVQLVLLETDDVNIVDSSHVTLQNFAKYKAYSINALHDAAVLLTAKCFDGRHTFGAAFTSCMCHHIYAASIASDFRKKIVTAAWTVAQNIGKNLGFKQVDHLASCSCSLNGACVMSKNFDVSERPRWSSCSFKNWHLISNSRMIHRSCLSDSPLSTYISGSSSSSSTSFCGNGIIENEEECDCGPPELCSSRCCNAATCKLKPKAKCASGACCDKFYCKLRPAGYVCRHVDDSGCDLRETCDGKSEWCPKDDSKADGVECASGEAYCYKGKCQPRLQQCRKLFLDSSAKVANDYCYTQLNARSDNKGHCRFHLSSYSSSGSGSQFSYKYHYGFSSCSSSNRKCGLLHCESSIKLSDSNKVNYGSIECQSRPKIDLSSSGMRSPSLVPDGAKCGNGKMCVNSYCQSVTSFGCSYNCPDCNGKGVLTRNKLCFCHKGFAPPDCVSRGCGGSVSSTLCEPATEPRNKGANKQNTNTETDSKSTYILVGCGAAVGLTLFAAIFACYFCRKE